MTLTVIQRGMIFNVSDGKLTLPPEHLRGQAHESSRPFVILSNNTKNVDPSFPIVMGCPISSSTTYRTQYDVKLSAGEGNLRKKSWARIPALQPIAKCDLSDRLGQLDSDRLLDIDASIAEYLDMGS